MNIAFIGYGNVGGALADNLQRAGHRVTLAADDAASESVARALARNGDLRVAPPELAFADAEVVVLATPFAAVEEVLAAFGSQIDGKILIDCTNPVGPGLTHGLKNETSGTELVQKLLPGVRVVKTFSIYGAENLADSAYPGYDVKPVMMFCGNDADAKSVVAGLIDDLGWQPLDVGGIEQALHLEHMTLLWVRMVRVNGHSPNLVWAMLQR